MSLKPHAALLASKFGAEASKMRPQTLIDASRFKLLIVSHRRMVREDHADSHHRGLRDLDTGELFVVEERRLLDTAGKRS